MSWLNGPGHKLGMRLFLAIVLAHWVEHLAQAAQIWALGWTRPEAKGVLGLWFPWLVTSEWLHYAYAVAMLAAFVLLRPGVTGRARFWWDVALAIQAWHHFEHFLLLLQAWTAQPLFGKPVPTSIAQLVLPRVELHLLYNGIVFLPMLAGMVRHIWPPRGELRPACSCAVSTHAVAPTGTTA